ncbi:hypothetical protein HAX54_045610, partial [Datura stramonium]|nr:hypothetical protein [Datura stramonium]
FGLWCTVPANAPTWFYLETPPKLLQSSEPFFIALFSEDLGDEAWGSKALCGDNLACETPPSLTSGDLEGESS